MLINEVKRILCVGAGSMGQQIGLQCALRGYEVVLHSRREESLRKDITVINK